ncbi:hypothetical protein OS175_09210 [Marinicella sp. S1101]|uniref:hypothetical protein n=1 Tax=Marinicella marina TaxID=2996016 RepID=UPI002260CEDE|nr:hypothetical protein [Marinicella marina]MCX7554055.1 hypothetical protein [Marinicella marina]MDJ1140547.1 hypothetical protein [Marinicella marina]
MNKFKTLLLSTALMTGQVMVNQNPEPVLFGTVTLTNGETKTGTLRWDKQEAFLSDIFNGYKSQTVGFEHLSEDEKDALLDHQPGPQANIGDLQITFKSFFGKEIDPPEFSVNFGAIKRIDIDGSEVVLSLHDGSTISTDDNNNDTSDDILVKTTEGETSTHDFDDIKHIVFSAAPDDAKTFGDGIYGTVESSIGTFAGRIMWDKDERMTDEELDGNADNKEYEIKFADIKVIEKTAQGDASRVVLKDGEELVIDGTNDVNRGNRGIWIDNPELGRVEVSWRQFEKLTIGPVDVKWHEFADYAQASQPLSGRVQLKDGTNITAQAITYDMNQQSGAEILESEIGGNTRLIPFYNVNKLSKNENNLVELVLDSGVKTLALNHNSVTFNNNGLLLLSNNQYKYYPWEQIQTIELD